MHVLFYYFFGGGGGLSHLMQLLPAWATAFPQDRLSVVCAADSPMSKVRRTANLDVVGVPPGRLREATRLGLSLGGLARLSRDRQADAVWVINYGAFSRLAVPQILSVYNAYQVYPHDQMPPHPSGRVTAALLRSYSNWTARVCDSVVVQTPLMAEYTRRHWPKCRVEVVGKAVEPESGITPQPLPAACAKMLERPAGQTGFDFVYVATDMPHKNHRVVVEALGELAKKRGDIRVIFSLSLEKLLPLLGEAAPLAQRLADEKRLIPLGWVDKSWIAALYAAAQGCVMPSTFESLSSAHLEAMQWQRPQVTSDLPYARDLCGDAALYAPPHDAAAWAAAMARVADEPQLRSELVACGQTRILAAPQSWGEVAGLHRELFCRLRQARGLSIA